VCSDIAVCGKVVVITVEPICCMLIVDAMIMATTFSFVRGGIGAWETRVSS
jgi:hypothetical protein